MGISALSLTLIGLLVERIAYGPVYSAGRLPAVVSALGASIILQTGIMVIWRPRYQAYPPQSIPQRVFLVGDIHISLLQVIILVLSFLIMLGLYFLIQKTHYGAAIRAAAHDWDTAALMGIDFNKVILLIFTLGPARELKMDPKIREAYLGGSAFRGRPS